MDGHDLAWDFIRLAWELTANQAVACLQDVTVAWATRCGRNFPSVPSGNWQQPASMIQTLTHAQCARLRELRKIDHRQPPVKKAE